MSAKQNTFVYYLARLDDIKQAADAAKIDYQYGRRLATRNNIKEAVLREKEAIQAASGITAAVLKREWSHIAFADIVSCVDAEGNLLKIKDMPENIRRAISSIEVVIDAKGTVTHKIRFWSKPDALENLGKIIGVYAEDNKQKTDGIAELLGLIDGRSKGLPDKREAEED